MVFHIAYENPKLQARADFNDKNNIIATPPKTERKKYEKALNIYKEETGDTNLYISDDIYDIDGSLRTDFCALKYKARNKSLHRFWEIFYVLEYKEILSNYEKDKISIYLKPKSRDEILKPKNITGLFVSSDENEIKIKSDKNNEILTIKYTEIDLIDDDYEDA